MHTLQPNLRYNHLSSIPLVFLAQQRPFPCLIVTAFIRSGCSGGISILNIGGCLLSYFELARQICKLSLGGSDLSA
jgi:hypothetical protein